MSCPTTIIVRPIRVRVVTNPQGPPGPPGPGGDTFTAEAVVTLVAGEAVYVNGTAKADKSKADAGGTKRCRGLVSTGAAAGFAATIRSHGSLTLADWTAIAGSATLTPNAPYYVSAATAGAITSTPPTSGWITRVGTALSTTVLDVNPEPPIKL